MTKNIIHLKEHGFKKGYDPRRNLKGAPKGKNFRYAFGQEMFAKHRDSLEEVVDKVIQRAIEGHEQSQRMCFEYFITKPVADITVESCEDNVILDEMSNIPKDVLQDIRCKFLNALEVHNNTVEEEEQND